MMATLRVHNVPDQLYEALKACAQAKGCSLSAEVISILQRALSRYHQNQRDLLESLQRRQRFRPAKTGAPSSLEMLREDRER